MKDDNWTYGQVQRWTRDIVSSHGPEFAVGEDCTFWPWFAMMDSRQTNMEISGDSQHKED